MGNCWKSRTKAWRLSSTWTSPLTMAGTRETLVSLEPPINPSPVLMGEGYILYQYGSLLVWFSMTAIEQEFSFNGHSFVMKMKAHQEQDMSSSWSLIILERSDTGYTGIGLVSGSKDDFHMEKVDQYIESRQVNIRPFLLKSLIIQWPGIEIKLDTTNENIELWLEASRKAGLLTWNCLERDPNTLWTPSDTMNPTYNTNRPHRDSNNTFLDLMARCSPISQKYWLCVRNMDEWRNNTQAHPRFYPSAIIRATSSTNESVNQPRFETLGTELHEWKLQVGKRGFVGIESLFQYSFGKSNPLPDTAVPKLGEIVVIHNRFCPEEIWSLVVYEIRAPFIVFWFIHNSISSPMSLTELYKILKQMGSCLLQPHRFAIAAGLISMFPINEINSRVLDGFPPSTVEWNPYVIV